MEVVLKPTGRNKDDRVIASALACAAFAEQVQPSLIAQKYYKVCI
jgi:hypothetical protein